MSSRLMKACHRVESSADTICCSTSGPLSFFVAGLGELLLAALGGGRGWRRYDGADVAVGRLVEVDDHRGMVARPGALARVAVDPRGAHPAGDRRRGEHEIDAHAEVL